MTQRDESNRAPSSTVVGSWLALCVGWTCVIVWIAVKHAGRAWLAVGLFGLMVWAAFWLDYLQRSIEGRL